MGHSMGYIAKGWMLTILDLGPKKTDVGQVWILTVNPHGWRPAWSPNMKENVKDYVKNKMIQKD